MTVLWSAAFHALISSCVQRERGKVKDREGRADRKQKSTACRRTAVMQQWGETGGNLFLNSLCVAGSLWRVALVDKVPRVKCHKPTQEIVSEWERVRGGIVWLCFEHSVYCYPLQQLWIPSTWSSFTVPAAAIGWAVKDSSSQKITVCCLLLILVLPFFVFLAYCVEHQDRIAP